MVTRRRLLELSAAGFAASHTGFAPRSLAQTLGKTVHVLTGFTPGLPDAVARLVAGQMKSYATSIVVETRPGAGGRVAAEAVKAAEPDGSVILFGPLGFVTLFPHTYKTLRYEAGDFKPVSTVASFPMTLTVGPMVPSDVKTVADFIAWCRSNPKLATFGTAGVGTSLHLIGAMLGRAAGFEYLHVPYQGRAAIDDVLKGAVASAVMPMGTSLGLVQSGVLRALATTGRRRSSYLPDVPTFAESGYPSLEDITWFGFFVPARTPDDLVQALNSAIQEALASDEVKSGFTKLSVDLDPISVSAFQQLIASESARWKAMVQATGYIPLD